MALVKLTEVLFAGEVFFTPVKALALLSKNKNIRLFLATSCFLEESMLGLTLSLLLLLAAFGSFSTYAVARVVAAGVLLLIT